MKQHKTMLQKTSERAAAAVFIAKLFAKINVSKKYLLSIFVRSFFLFLFPLILPFRERQEKKRPAKVFMFEQSLVCVAFKNDLNISLIKISRHALSASQFVSPGEKFCVATFSLVYASFFPVTSLRLPQSSLPTSACN